MSARLALKRTLQAAALVLAFPSALLSGFGRWREIYVLFAHCHAVLPGFVGNFMRAAYYKMTLRESSVNVNIGFGTIFVHPEARLGSYVSVGAYCMVGRARIGDRTQIASHVEIPSGRHEHERDGEGRLGDSIAGETVVGNDCWIGSSAIVMAKVGDHSTIGAGSVVVKEIPPGSVAVGNPARVIRMVTASS